MIRPCIILILLLAAACGSASAPQQQANEQAAATPEAPVHIIPRPEGPDSDPAAPGQPGGLPDDRKPLSEAPFTADSPQGAAAVLQSYYALIEQGNYAEAFHLRAQGARGPTPEQFAKSFAKYAEYHANIGHPSEAEGAAGSLYVEVPVQIYGRLATGKPFSTAGTVTLRRSNNVPGGDSEWKIYTGG